MKECTVCESTDFSVVIAKERMIGLNDSFQYLECNSCKSLFLQDVPEDLSKFYPSNYYSFGKYIGSSSLSKVLKRLRYQAFKSGLSLRPPNYFEWLSRLKVKEQSKIADIGCGNGQLLAELSYCGFTSLHGYDPYQSEIDKSDRFSLKKIG